MNYGMVRNIIGVIMKVEGVLLALPLCVALLYAEGNYEIFIYPAALLFAIGFALSYKAPKNRIIYSREGFVIVALCWIAISIFGSIPFQMSGYFPSYIDSLFETISGFSTTGSTILETVEILPNSLLFWRALTQWVGGMGVLVFVLAVAPLAGERSLHLMRAEMPGPTIGKMTPRLRSTAKILYGIYIALTVILALLLALADMPLFDSIMYSMSTARTGGFSINNASIAFYDSAYIEGLLTLFMLLFSLNFNLFYLVLIGHLKQAVRSSELRTYIGIIIGAVLLMTISLRSVYGNIFEALRHAAFQVISVISTTCYSIADYNLWPELSKNIILLLMFIGACAVSTGGGIKIARLLILAKTAVREIKRLAHPRSVSRIVIDGKTVEEETIGATGVFFIIYVAIIFISFLILSLDGFDFVTTLSSVVACLNNIGPGLGAVGPMSNFSAYSGASKITMLFLMLAGRLEVFPMMMLFMPGIWKRTAK